MSRQNRLEETTKVSERIKRIIQQENFTIQQETYTYNKKIPSEFRVFKNIAIIKPKTIQNEKTFIC